MQTTPACVFSDRVGTEGGRIAGEEVSSGHAEAKMQLLLEKLQDAVERLQAGGRNSVPFHNFDNSDLSLARFGQNFRKL